MAKQDKAKQLFSLSKGQVSLFSPTKLPNAFGYLYNDKMLLQLNCRGYARSQFMQPEPAKYSHGPMLEAKTFIQPEQGYFCHHPGRFFYIKDHDSDKVYSVPYEPCRVKAKHFCFTQHQDKITWQVTYGQLHIDISVTLLPNAIGEHWQVNILNQGKKPVSLSFYPYFSVGYQSWMYREADYDPELAAIIARSITPYQQLSDFEKNQTFKDSTFLLANCEPNAWQCCLLDFEGQGGLANPDGVKRKLLANKPARYEDSVAVMQFDLALNAQQQHAYEFVFGAAKDKAEVSNIKQSLFNAKTTAQKSETQCTAVKIEPAISFESQQLLFQYASDWLPKQIDYHGRLHRLSTDPQTRNYLQDAIGMSFLDAHHTKNVLLTALSQQASNGEMPDGVLLCEQAQLKYINQVPHADANIWLPITLLSYLNETNDVSILQELICFADSDEKAPLYQHIELALEFVLAQRDERGLCLIHQGDWCDPMNMVGHKGKGVSSWLTLALAYAIKCWIAIIQHYASSIGSLAETLTRLNQLVDELNYAVNLYCWHGDWYARGITDEDQLFGIADDNEGRIYLNPQSWALLSGAATMAKKFTILNEVERQLNTPYGVMMLAPSYTQFRPDVGRLTQKYPGTAENGSVYNHAAIFYIYALYQAGEYNQAYQLMLKMLPNEKDLIARGQLPNFIPNYYRGAYFQYPEHAGRSSHMLNTGTVAWLYRCIIEELCGLKGHAGKLIVHPKLPDSLNALSGCRRFLGAEFHFSIEKQPIDKTQLLIDGKPLPNNIVDDIVHGRRYQLEIRVPR